MIRAVAFAALLLAVVAGAAAMRTVDLDNRPVHCDEANHAIKFGLLLERGEYAYNPREYHGPTLNYLTLPLAWLTSTQTLPETTEVVLRLVPAIFGIALVGLVWLLRDELGDVATLAAALLAAVSPAMVFYSRYYIQEMLLVFFTFAAMVAFWRYVRTIEDTDSQAATTRGRSIGRFASLLALGASIGLMHASKETAAIAIASMLVGAAVAVPGLRKVGWLRLLGHAATVVVVAAGVSALFFSSFFKNPQGIVDSYTTYTHYFSQAAGEGSTGAHDKPWHYYLRELFWWKREGGALWTEAPIAVLALVGLVAGAMGKGLTLRHHPIARFLAVYAVLMTVVYCAIPYKTPWCALGFLHGMILLAGIGAAVLVRIAPGYAGKAAAMVLILAAATHLGWQAHRASFVAYEDRTNPYVYSQTTSDIPRLAERVREVASFHPAGQAMDIQVICRDDDFWPLPWYLRDFSRAHFLDEPPDHAAAPLIITQPNLEAKIADYLMVKQPKGQRHQYVPFADRQGNERWELYPNQFLVAFIRRDFRDAIGSRRTWQPNPPNTLWLP